MAWDLISPFFFSYVFSEQAFTHVTVNLQTGGATFVSLFVAGFSPIPFKIFTIAGGVVSAPLIPFFVACVLSRGLRYFILGGVVYFMGDRAQVWIERNFDRLTIIVSVLLILTVLGIKLIV